MESEKNERETRRLDDLGRIVLPNEFRGALGWNTRTPIDVVFDKVGRTIILEKHLEVCSICRESGDEKELKQIKGQFICKDCICTLNKE